MSHGIVAIISKDPLDAEKAAAFDLAVFHENGYNIIGLDGCHSRHWAQEFGIFDDFSDFFGHPDGVFVNITLVLAREIGLQEFGLIATDYFGGFGNQAARLFRDGEEIFLPGYQTKDLLFPGVSINEVLREIGVVAKPGCDEFDTLNLSNYRSFEDNYLKYNMD